MASNMTTDIPNEEKAVRLLEQALREQLSDEVAQTLKFDGWPVISIRLTGPVYKGTITAANAKALIEIQRAVDHAYLQLVRPVGRRLTEEERRKTAITASVSEGSSLMTVQLDQALTQLASELVTKMSPEQILVVVLGLGLIAGTTAVVKQYVKSRAEKSGKEKELAADVALSQEETKRLTVVTDAMSKQPVLATARENFDTARDEILRSAIDAKTVTLDGVTLTGAQARVLPREPRETSIEVQLNGTYLIAAVSWPAGKDEAIFDLCSTTATLEFKASLSTQSLVQKDKDLLASAGWGRTPVYLQINAHMLRGEVTKAVVVGFDWEKLRADGSSSIQPKQ